MRGSTLSFHPRPLPFCVTVYSADASWGELVMHLRVPLDPVHHAIPVTVKRSAGVFPLVEAPLSLATPANSCHAWKMSQGNNVASSPSEGSLFRSLVKLVLIASKYLHCLQRKIIYDCFSCCNSDCLLLPCHTEK